ncbi:MAG: hypothetical protein HQM08_29160 [Candidatus Riflebacteria bacterium]|nr:hypothetical protein [Candidatus Riflebacteria bacterium]
MTRETGLSLITRAKPESKLFLEKGEFHHSDDSPKIILGFCRKHNIPYSKDFVSIAVYAGEEPPRGLGRCYGDLKMVLKPGRIVPDIKVICKDDFQDLVINAAKKEKAGLPIENYLGKIITDLPNTFEGRYQFFLKVVREARGKYVEARVFRQLAMVDVETLDDESFFGNLEKHLK